MSRSMLPPRTFPVAIAYTFGNAQSFGEPMWSAGDTLVHVPRYGRVRVFAVPGMVETRSFGPWVGDASVVEGNVVFGVGSGELRRGRPSDGEMRVVRRFEFPEMWALEVFP